MRHGEKISEWYMYGAAGFAALIDSLVLPRERVLRVFTLESQRLGDESYREKNVIITASRFILVDIDSNSVKSRVFPLSQVIGMERHSKLAADRMVRSDYRFINEQMSIRLTRGDPLTFSVDRSDPDFEERLRAIRELHSQLSEALWGAGRNVGEPQT